MRLDKVLPRLQEAFKTGDVEKLMSVARSLGYELSRSQRDVINDFRSEACQYTDEKIPFEFILTLLFAWDVSLREREREDYIFQKLNENRDWKIILVRAYAGALEADDFKNAVIQGEGDLETVESNLIILCRAGLLENYGSERKIYRLSLLGERMIKRFFGL